jgi:hypothetical protein
VVLPLELGSKRDQHEIQSCSNSKKRYIQIM